jgi:hypothetical protein
MSDPIRIPVVDAAEASTLAFRLEPAKASRAPGRISFVTAGAIDTMILINHSRSGAKFAVFAV